MSRSLESGIDTLTAFCAEFETGFRRHDMGTAIFREIRDIADWGKSQLSMLAYRVETIEELGDGASPGFLLLPDDLDDLERARRLAKKVAGVFSTRTKDEQRDQAAEIHAYADDIAALKKDPQAAAAFYASLPPHIRDDLPQIIAATGSSTAKEDLAAFSQVLGAALAAPTAIPGFAKVRSQLLKPAGRDVAWNRLALLKGSGAPASYRASAARALALDEFVAGPRGDFRAGTVTDVSAYGFPPDTVAMALSVLEGDGAVIRDTFARMGGDDVRLSQTEKMKLFVQYAKGHGYGDQVADSLGRVLADGSEAEDERPGRHSPEAAAFAFDTIAAMGSFGEDLPLTAADSMSAIAKSYAHEMVTGARIDRALYRSSTIGAPEGWTDVAGITPSFHLSPGDTYRFLRTFAADERATGDFDAAMATFYHDTMVSAARLDRGQDSGQFETASKVFGDFGGIEYKAISEVRGEMDAQDELLRDIVKNTFSLGIDKLPVGELAGLGGAVVRERVVNAAWDVAKAYGVSTALDGWADSFETRAEKLEAKQLDYVVRHRYDLAGMLYEAGFPASPPPPGLISGTTGRLKTYDEIVAEATREAGNGDREKTLRDKLARYERWMDDNPRFDAKMEDSARLGTSTLSRDVIDIWS
ncbi:hypothetical protein [Nonomuraea fuscirosea]|uniref:hypothetical protein n=1 Tax=Nonomuraea fuscirosea TaxID=1291556 RepID=UPI003436E7D5